MKINRILPLLFCGALAVGLPSCGDDEPETNGGQENPIPTPEPSPSDKVYTPTEAKDHIVSVAQEFINLFKPEDQKQAIEFARYFCDHYGDLEMPYEFDIEDDDEDYYGNPARYMRLLLRGLSEADPAALTRATEVYTYDINFPRFAGVYRPQGNRWVRVAKSDNIVFEFTTRSGATGALTATASSETSDWSMEFTDEWEDWDGNGYVDVEDLYKYNFSIPRTVSVKVTDGSTTIASGDVNSSVDIKGHNFRIDASTSVANLAARVVANGTDTQINANFSLDVNGKQVTKGTAVVNGYHLCDYDYIKNNLDRDELSAVDMISNASATVDVLGKIQADASGKYNREIDDLLDDDLYWDSYDYSKSEAEKLARNAADVLNRNLSGAIRFNGTGTKQATFRFIPKFDEYGYSWGEYSLVPVMVFDDGTQYEVEEYFETGFGSVTSLFESVIDQYENAWDRF